MMAPMPEQRQVPGRQASSERLAAGFHVADELLERLRLEEIRIHSASNRLVRRPHRAAGARRSPTRRRRTAGKPGDYMWIQCRALMKARARDSGSPINRSLITATLSAPAVDDSGRALERDTTYCDERHSRRSGDRRSPADRVQSDGVVPGLLGSSAKDRPNGHVGDRLRNRGGELPVRMCVESPTTARSPTIRRTCAGGRSVCPTCTPAASAIAAMSARSFTITIAAGPPPVVISHARSRKAPLSQVLARSCKKTRAGREKGARDLHRCTAGARADLDVDNRVELGKLREGTRQQSDDGAESCLRELRLTRRAPRASAWRRTAP